MHFENVEEENKSLYDETLTETSSFGIRSFTVEVTTASEKPPPSSSTPAAATEKIGKTLTHLNNMSKDVTKKQMFQKSNKKKSLPIKLATIGTTTSTAMTTPESVDSSSTVDTEQTDRLNEQKLKNGLYRIKIAEIITDEFGLSEDEIKQRLAISKNKQQYNNGKINIADLYPSKLEDFAPIIKQ